MSEQSIQGDFYYANQSQRYKAFLTLEGSEIIVRERGSNRVLISTQQPAITLSDRLAQTARLIYFADGSVFETQAHDFIDEFLLQKNKSITSKFLATKLHHLENKLHYVAVMLILVVGFVWGFVQYGIPFMAQGIAKMIPEQVTQKIAQGSLELLDEHYFSPSQLTRKAQQRIRQHVQPLMQQYSHLNIQLAFRHGNKLGANAFALPDAHIVITDELIKLSENDDEITAIVAHEVGHIKHQHLLRRVVQDSMMTAVLVLMTGDVSYASSVIVAVPTLLLELAYSRGFEQEADRFAHDYLLRQHISLSSFVNIMQRLQAEKMSKRSQRWWVFYPRTHKQMNA